MSKDPVRFTSQWALIGVIMFYSIGTTLIARHTKRIFKPASAGGSEHIKYSYSGISENLNRPDALSGAERRQNSTADLMQWDVDQSNLMLYDAAFGYGQFYEDGSTYESSEQQSSEKQEEKEVKQELTKIRTNKKCIETVLRKAEIQTYSISGQVKGLQINGLDKISQAKDLLLKSGDIVLAVNGQTLKSKKEAYGIFKKAWKEPIMIIDLVQDGQAKKYLIDFQ